MRNVGLTLILLASCVLFIRGNTKCKLSENAEKKAVSQLNTCIDKGFKTSQKSCQKRSVGNQISKKERKKCKKIEKKLSACAYKCPGQVITVVIDPRQQSVKESETARLTCSTKVPHPSNIHWDRFVLDSEGYEDITKFAIEKTTAKEDGSWEVSSVLKLGPLASSDGGNYRCSLKGYPATAEAALFVERKNEPMLVIAPQKLSQKESETATFSCSMEVSHPTKIFWHRFVLNSDGYKDITEEAAQKVTATQEGIWKVESNLVVKQLNYYDGGNYRCSVKEYPVSAQALLFVQKQTYT
ncbi:hypothetical protein ACHWQZ_G009217 [Mnemiopsis leidyi]